MASGDMHIRLGNDFLKLFATRVDTCANVGCQWHSLNHEADGDWDCTLRTIHIGMDGQCERFLQMEVRDATK